VELIGGERLQRREYFQLILFNAMDQGPSPTTYGTIAHPDMIKLSAHLEADEAAMTTSTIDGHRGPSCTEL